MSAGLQYQFTHRTAEKVTENFQTVVSQSQNQDSGPWTLIKENIFHLPEEICEHRNCLGLAKFAEVLHHETLFPHPSPFSCFSAVMKPVGIQVGMRPQTWWQTAPQKSRGCICQENPASFSFYKVICHSSVHSRNLLASWSYSIKKNGQFSWSKHVLLPAYSTNPKASKVLAPPLKGKFLGLFKKSVSNPGNLSHVGVSCS